MSDKYAYFDVHPSVVFKLGEDLITDSFQALAELVKNGYDADATRVIVRIETTVELSGSDVGRVEIVDNGTGMTPDTLRRGWLTISNSTKREMKAQGRTTARGRTPLGDKGLGRLGAQRLGNKVEIETSTGDGLTHRMAFDWRDFVGRDALRDVPVEITTERDGRTQSGTSVRILGLNDPQILSDRSRIQTELSRAISPYREIDAFRLFVSVDGESLDLGTLDKRIRSASTVRYELDFDGSELRVAGKIRLAQFRPNAKDERAMWARIAEDDRGHGFLAHLRSLPEASTFKLRASKSRSWWAELEFVIALEDVTPPLDDDGKPATPGAFFGEIDSFNLAAGSVERVGVFDKAAELRGYLKDMHGIRIYRDGFNVRAPDDWLGLGRQITSGGSWYGLRPATTMGFVAISAASNQQLKETTDREGFVQTPHYESFEKLLREFVRRTADAQEFIGRGAVSWRRLFDLPPADDEATTSALLESVSAKLTEAKSYIEPLREVSRDLSVGAAEADAWLDAHGRRASTSAEDQQLLELINRLSRQASKASEFVDSLETFVVDVGQQQTNAKRVQAELEALTEQFALTYETVAVGLTAEALAHEIGNISERLARRSTEARRFIRKRYPDDVQLLRFVEQVQGVVAGLRRQLAHLAPSLRYVRERRETLIMSDVLAEVRSYYEDRWDDSISIETSIESDFAITMNRGKFLQIVDNLILNSEYWLNEQVRLGKLEDPQVSITVSEPFVTISDNGVGVDPQIETALFEPFVSKKPRGVGRGLGLFIIRQLLDAEGCEIALAPERNRHGRQYVFGLDFTNVITDD